VFGSLRGRTIRAASPEWPMRQPQRLEAVKQVGRTTRRRRRPGEAPMHCRFPRRIGRVVRDPQGGPRTPPEFPPLARMAVRSRALPQFSHWHW
jgi:hypothetical protein